MSDETKNLMAEPIQFRLMAWMRRSFDYARRETSVWCRAGFAEGIGTKEDARRIVKEVFPMPMLLNMAVNIVTPNWTVSEAKEFCFKIFIFPFRVSSQSCML